MFKQTHAHTYYTYNTRNARNTCNPYDTYSIRTPLARTAH